MYKEKTRLPVWMMITDSERVHAMKARNTSSPHRMYEYPSMQYSWQT